MFPNFSGQPSGGFDWRALLSQQQPANAPTPAVQTTAPVAAGALPPQPQPMPQNNRGLNGALNFAERLGGDIGGALGVGAAPAAASAPAAAAGSAGGGAGFLKILASLFGA